MYSGSPITHYDDEKESGPVIKDGHYFCDWVRYKFPKQEAAAKWVCEFRKIEGNVLLEMKMRSEGRYIPPCSLYG